MGTTEKLAQFIVGTGYDDMPAGVIHAAKRAMIDTLGVMIAGSREPAASIIAAFVRDQGGNPNSSVVGKGFKTTSPNAALANGTMGHALDYDDVGVGGHPTVTLIPAILALAEETGASGKAVLASLVIGFEIWSRFGISGIDPRTLGFHPTAVFGTMGAAASASRLLDLDVKKTRMALGLAASHAVGMSRNRGTMTKPFHAGKASASGLLSALLVNKGFTASPDLLEGRFGFYDVFTGAGGKEDGDLTKNLGNPYAIISPGLNVKKYPVCYLAHRAVDAILELRTHNGIRAEDVLEIRCEGGTILANVLMYHEPNNYLQGKFSMEFCLATALAEGQLGPLQVTDEKVNDSEIQELMKRVRLDFSGPYVAEKEVVHVKLKDGNEHTLGVEKARGAAEIPLTDEEIITKYRNCAPILLSSEESEQVLDQMLNMDKLQDVNELMGILGKGK